MRHPLEAIDWRLERAHKHLATLDKEVSAFFARLNKVDRRFVGHFERETSEYVIRLNCEAPDPRIGLIVGEFGHHLRAALDNLVWQLVLLRGGSPTRATEYPIYESWERYQERKGWRSLRGVSADDRAAIEGTQPYQHGERASESYLSLLSWLNNVDKHRFVHVGGALPRTLPVPAYLDYGGESRYAGQLGWLPQRVKDVAEILDVRYIPPVARDDPTELMRVRLRPAGPDPQVEMKGDESLQVVLSDPQRSLSLSDLGYIEDNVFGVIEGFRPRFNI